MAYRYIPLYTVFPQIKFQTWPGRPSVYLTPSAYMSMVFNIKLGFLLITVKRHYKHVPKITPGINARVTFLWHSAFI